MYAFKLPIFIWERIIKRMSIAQQSGRTRYHVQIAYRVFSVIHVVDVFVPNHE